MQVKRRAVMVGTTFFLAAATGHLMQNGDIISERLQGVREAKAPQAAPAPAPAVAVNQVKAPDIIAAPVVQSSAAETAFSAAVLTAASKTDTLIKTLPDFPAVQPSPFSPAKVLAARMDALDSRYERPETDADAAYSVFGIACTPSTMTLEPGARAMLKLALTASCYPNESVRVSHAGLNFAVATDIGGEMELVMPAMASEALVEVHFGSVEKVSAQQSVSGLDALSRVAVQWEGPDALHLNAYENGATFGEAGHVSSAHPRGRATSLGGFLTLLGDSEIEQPMLAEVYTAPEGTKLDALVLEAVVTEGNCGQTITGQTLRVRPDGEPEASEVSFAMPDCDAVGDYLALDLTQAAPPDLTVALGDN